MNYYIMNNCPKCEKNFAEKTREILNRKWYSSRNSYYQLMETYENPNIDMEYIIDATFDLIEGFDRNDVWYSDYNRCVCDSCNLTDYDYAYLPKDVNNFFYKKLFNFIKENIDIFQNCSEDIKENLKFNIEFLTKYVSKSYKKYYKEIFGIPYELRNCNIPQEHYNLRQDYYFDDVIAGHPMASNGWFAEGLQELVDMGVIVD